MKRLRILFLSAIVMLVCFGCGNDDNSIDMAADIAGSYTGTWDVSGYTRSGACEVIRVSDTSVKLTLEILGVELPDIPHVTLSDGGNGKTNLSYSDSEGSVAGSVQGKVIIVTISDGTTSFSFTGNKS
jgi:hypothetical protein